MSAPWFAVDERDWEEGAAEIPKPWPLAFARMDLRHHENRARMKAAPFPGRVALMARWGWTDRQVRRLLDADDWHDPSRPVARGDLRQKWAGVQRAANEPPTERPTECQQDDGPTPDIDTNPPTECQQSVQRAANEASIARASSGTTINHDETTNTQAAACEQEPAANEAGLSPAAALGQFWRELMAIRTAAALDPVDPGTEAQHVRELELTDPRRRSLSARVRDFGTTRLAEAWRWMWTSRHERAAYLRAGGSPADTFLRPSNCVKYIELAESPGGWPTRPNGRAPPGRPEHMSLADLYGTPPETPPRTVINAEWSTP